MSILKEALGAAVGRAFDIPSSSMKLGGPEIPKKLRFAQVWGWFSISDGVFLTGFSVMEPVELVCCLMYLA